MTRKEETAAISVKECHRLLGLRQISKNAIYSAIARGQIPHMRCGSRILISRAWVDSQLKGK
jgi:excisionase family DNA binding protein